MYISTLLTTYNHDHHHYLQKFHNLLNLYFLSPERNTPTPPMATDKGTSNNPAKTPAGNPTNGTSTLFTTKAPSKPANAAAARKKAGGPTSKAPATTGNRRGAPSTTKGATPLMRSC
mmetsp:Transcript_8405/g.15866  ORF Transcript_8405/g.15866 Transcript_8405/m.15866 type:complete len:117 (+) Transcript_8405:247-597(+)